MARRLVELAGISALACLALTRPARATYSIVAADTQSREVGGAGTSCLDGQDVYVIYGSVPGVGAVHAQARLNERGRDRAVELVARGVSPPDVIAEITSPAFDPGASSRQYAVVTADAVGAAFTGSAAQSHASDVQGRAGAFAYSVQGNILTGPAVIAQAAEAFAAGGCDLADRLMRALEAGAEDGQGEESLHGPRNPVGLGVFRGRSSRRARGLVPAAAGAELRRRKSAARAARGVRRLAPNTPVSGSVRSTGSTGSAGSAGRGGRGQRRRNRGRSAARR